MFRTAAVCALGLASASAYKLAADELLKRDGAHAHEHADSGYGAPPATYEEPAASYGAPAPSYGAPETGYGPPAETYGVPSYEEEPLPDLTPIIVGILVLTGLSLLFPTFVSLTDVRKKRHADDGKKLEKKKGFEPPSWDKGTLYHESLSFIGVVIFGLRSKKFRCFCIRKSFLSGHY